jgi:hypothetical protein
VSARFCNNLAKRLQNMVFWGSYGPKTTPSLKRVKEFD